MAALDYARLLERRGEPLSLLFVAHREEILEQSSTTYRAVLRDGSFGQKHGGGAVAAGSDVFAMIQSPHEDGWRRSRRTPGIEASVSRGDRI